MKNTNTVPLCENTQESQHRILCLKNNNSRGHDNYCCHSSEIPSIFHPYVRVNQTRTNTIENCVILTDLYKIQEIFFPSRNTQANPRNRNIKERELESKLNMSFRILFTLTSIHIQRDFRDSQKKQTNKKEPYKRKQYYPSWYIGITGVLIG